MRINVNAVEYTQIKDISLQANQQNADRIKAFVIHTLGLAT